MSDEQKPDNVDRMEFKFPFGGGFSVSGRNASKLFWAVGVTAIIIALGWAVANVIGALNHDSTTQLSGLSRDSFGGQYKTDLPRWGCKADQADGSSLSYACRTDRRDRRLRWLHWVQCA